MKHHNADYYIHQASKAGLEVKNGGSHTLIYGQIDGERTRMAIPRHRGDLATGTEHTIQKWLLKLGVAFTLICGVLAVLAQGV